MNVSFCCSASLLAFGIISILDFDHFNRCVVVSHCCFNLPFRAAIWCGTTFHMLICHFYFFLNNFLCAYLLSIYSHQCRVRLLLSDYWDEQSFIRIQQTPVHYILIYKHFLSLWVLSLHSYNEKYFWTLLSHWRVCLCVCLWYFCLFLFFC